MHKIFLHYFSKLDKPFCKNLHFVVSAMMRCCSSNTAIIASEMAKDTKSSFKSNDMRLFRFFKSSTFQIDDLLWRCYLKIVFSLIRERNLFKEGDKIFINVDHTTMKDYFLIMTASISVNGKAVPLYFTLRNYPKKKGMLDQKKMERAFIKGLRHVLSKKYNYTIVADRGFGNNRFTSLCKEYKFNYVIRLKSDLNISYNNKLKKLENYRRSKDLKQATIKAWKREERIVIHRKGKALWWIVTDLHELPLEQVVKHYENRFKIEKCFQDQKSSGFYIEDTKIRKYDRFKRLLFCISLAQLFIVFLGDIISNEKHYIKKKFPLHIAMILAYSRLEEEHCSL